MTDEELSKCLEIEAERDLARINNNKLRALLKECADDLADMVEGHYAATKDHPAMKRRYDRDMTSVIRAREALVENLP